MNRFLLLWSLTSPGCLVLIGGILWITDSNWYPFDTNIWKSVVIYLVYWILLGSIQGTLIWKYQHRHLARQWFLATSIAGFLIMMCHEVTPLILHVDVRGQGIIFLVMTLPILAILGGLILGATQIWLLANYRSKTLPPPNSALTWILASFLSWIVGFVGIVFFIDTPFSLIPFVTAGAAIKSYSLMKYLQAPVVVDP